MSNQQILKNSILGNYRLNSLVVTKSDTPRIIILGITLILVFIFWIWVIIKIYNNAPTSTYYLQCSIGKCATNIFSGEKRCIEDNTSMVTYDPSYEVCSSRYICDNTTLPYAEQEDGSTNTTGICPNNTTCKCYDTPRCPGENIVTFSSRSGILGGGLDPNQSSSISILQTSHIVQGNVGIPLKIEDKINDFCEIRPLYLNRMVPRTGECSYSGIPDYDTLLACIQSNPCTMGLMVFKPNNISDYEFKIVDEDTGDVTANLNVVVGCVAKYDTQPACESDEVPVWDNTQDSVVCMK